ncbi:hypothetical protein [Streptacidiphilus sp. EB103A]|uniref:hypothetical protein n=1 Tax=Streptacidiphilus sp. EB103A TaxID=3156275 RepID=UPI003517013C
MPQLPLFGHDHPVAGGDHVYARSRGTAGSERHRGSFDDRALWQRFQCVSGAPLFGTRHQKEALLMRHSFTPANRIARSTWIRAASTPVGAKLGKALMG